MNIRRKILISGITFTLLLVLVLSYNSYQRFYSIILQNHERDVLRTAETALTLMDTDNFSAYNQDTPDQKELLDWWQTVVDTQDAMFIYVIEPFNDYKNIRFGVNVKNSNSDPNFKVRAIGYVMQTSSEEYKKAYKELYDGTKNYSVIMRDNGVSKTGDHVTAMLPIKNSGGRVEGILCAQWQMDDLDNETILFLTYTITVTLIYLLLMLFIGIEYLNLKLLNPLSALTEGVKEISSGNLNKKLEIKTGDKLQTLAENFNTMTDELKMQISNLEKVTAEKERIATELDVATKI